MYSAPLMGFIDNNCHIFDDEEENKLEFTDVHNKFKALVDDLITGFIADLGVEDKVFMDAVTSKASSKLNSFVLTSILTVDDFVQFKAMMVKRNTDLTAEVLEMHAKAQNAAAGNSANSEGTANSENNENDSELEEALRLSREQFEIEKSRADMFHPPETSEEEALSRALTESLKETASLDRERAELEQAIALSLALQQEQERLLKEVEAGEFTPPSPMPPPAAAAAPAAPKPLPKPLPNIAPVAAAAVPPPPAPVASIPAPVASIPPVSPASNGGGMSSTMSMSGSIRAGSSAGYSSSSSSASFDPNEIRKAAQAAADTQRALVAKRDQLSSTSQNVKKVGLGDVSQAELQRRSEYLKQQREILVAKKAEQRKAEMEAYKAAQTPMAKRGPLNEVPAELMGSAASPEAPIKDIGAEEDARARLRQDLARHMKQQLMTKQMEKMTNFDARR